MLSSRLYAFAAVLALTAPGCDLVGASDALGDVSSSDRAELADLTGAFFDCDAEVREVTDRASGTLESGDCLQTDGSYQDFYAFRLDERADVRVEMTSSEVAPYLFLLEADLGSSDPLVEVDRDRNATRTDRAGVSATLPAGLYLLYANSVSADETGDYTLSVEADATSENRPAARASVGGGSGRK
ncbi:MAG TPA: hypothetical protein VGB53_09130 [Rubricoccaceae bacterium]|jgi:hypothetical protein